MGLDMYLVVDGSSNPQRAREVVEAAGLMKRDWLFGQSVENEEGTDPIVAYWRKANAIHGWIVRALAAGVDECQRIDITVPQMRDLIDRCKRVLEAPAEDREEVAAEVDLMPTQGFFFGSYHLDDWYINDLKDTVTQLEDVLNAKGLGEASFYYEASW